MAKFNLNAEESVFSKTQHTQLSDCKTEEELIEFIAEFDEKLDKDAEVFVLSSKKDIGELSGIMSQVLESDEVMEKKVFEFAIANIKDSNKRSNLEGFEFIEFSDDVNENRALINFVYYGSQHRNQIRKAQRKLALMKEDYYKVFSGKTTLRDWLGDE